MRNRISEQARVRSCALSCRKREAVCASPAAHLNWEFSCEYREDFAHSVRTKASALFHTLFCVCVCYSIVSLRWTGRVRVEHV